MKQKFKPVLNVVKYNQPKMARSPRKKFITLMNEDVNMISAMSNENSSKENDTVMEGVVSAITAANNIENVDLNKDLELTILKE